MIMKKIFTFLNFLIIVLSCGQGLIMNQIQVKSPQTYAFEKYGNIPVNIYTGMIDMRIPLVSIAIDSENSLDLLLSYDSSGFTPHKKSDLSGVNWSLIAGGKISRNINRLPDDYEGSPGSVGQNPFDTGVDLHGFLKGVRDNQYSNTEVYNLYGYAGGITGADWRLGPLNGGYEGEPDLFSFSIMDLNGKFMIGNDGNVVVESNDPNIKVDLSGLETHGQLNDCILEPSEIKLTDGKGNIYYFGGDFEKQEVSYPVPTENGPVHDISPKFYTVNAWSISKIEFISGKTVSFDYVKGDLQDNYQSTFCSVGIGNVLVNNAKILSLEAYFQNGITTGVFKNCAGFPGCAAAESTRPRNAETFILLKKSLLETIRFGDTNIMINYKDVGYPIRHNKTATKLMNEFVVDDITLNEGTRTIKNYKFTYADYGGINKRPFLKTLSETLSSSKYFFDYYNTNNLPSYYTFGIDHWGFWNGKDTNTELVDPGTYDVLTGDYTLNGTVRGPNLNLYNVGLLNKITYPTGGNTVFEYESPTYGKRVERISNSAFLPILTNNGGSIGGARIKKIFNYSQNGVLANEKEYQYTTALNGSTSSGILMNWPRYLYFIEWKSNDGVIYQSLYLKSSSNVQQNTLDSYNIGYSKVFEIDKNKGYVEHNFYDYNDRPDLMSDASNIRNLTDDPPHSGVIPSYPVNLAKNFKNLFGTDRSVLRGKPKSDIIYSQNSTLPLKKVEYSYTDNISFNPNTILDEKKYVAINHQSGEWVQGYKKYFNSSYLQKKIITEYLQGSIIVSNTEYFYDNPINLGLSRQKDNLPGSNVIETTYKYADELNVGKLIGANMLGVPLKTIVEKNGKKIDGTEIKYNNAINLLPSAINKFNKQTLNSPNPTVSQEISYDEYDDKGNLLQYTSRSNIPTTIIWGYNKKYPIAKIEGAEFNDIKANTLISAIISAADADGINPNTEPALLTAFKKLRNGVGFENYHITTYTYDPLIGVTSITPPTGISEIYKYDNGNKLEKILDRNNNIVKEFNYKYTIITFYNDVESKPFTKNDCGVDYVGSTHMYTVPARTYSSTVSPEAAQQLAKDDVNANGQNTANNIGTCAHQCKAYGDENFIEGNLPALTIDEVSSNHYSGFIDITFKENAHFAVGLGNLGTCAPTTTKVFTHTNINNITWTLTLYPTGDVTIKSNTGATIQGESANFYFEYDK